MNKKILFNHPILGDITFSDVINDLKLIIDDTKNFEEIILNLLREYQMSDEDISTLFNYSVLNRLEWILFLLENNIQSDEKQNIFLSFHWQTSHKNE